MKTRRFVHFWILFRVIFNVNKSYSFYWINDSLPRYLKDLDISRQMKENFYFNNSNNLKYFFDWKYFIKFIFVCALIFLNLYVIFFVWEGGVYNFVVKSTKSLVKVEYVVHLEDHLRWSGLVEKVPIILG